MAHLKSVQTALRMCEENASKVMSLRLPNGSDITPGQYVPRADLADLPTLSWKGAEGNYVLVNLDLDAPFPSFAFLSPILHYIQSHVTIDTQTGAILFGPDVGPIATWRPPRPPPISSAHRYVFMLFRQPESLNPESHRRADGEPLARGDSMRFDFDGFIERAGIEAEPVAATWFTSN